MNKASSLVLSWRGKVRIANQFWRLADYESFAASEVALLCLSCQRVQQVSLANAFFLPYLSCLQPTSDVKTNVGNSQRTVGEKKTENKPIEQWCCYSGKVIEGKYKRI